MIYSLPSRPRRIRSHKVLVVVLVALVALLACAAYWFWGLFDIPADFGQPVHLTNPVQAQAEYHEFLHPSKVGRRSTTLTGDHLDYVLHRMQNELVIPPIPPTSPVQLERYRAKVINGALRLEGVLSVDPALDLGPLRMFVRDNQVALAISLTPRRVGSNLRLQPTQMTMGRTPIPLDLLRQVLNPLIPPEAGVWSGSYVEFPLPQLSAGKSDKIRVTNVSIQNDKLQIETKW